MRSLCYCIIDNQASDWSLLYRLRTAKYFSIVCSHNCAYFNVTHTCILLLLHSANSERKDLFISVFIFIKIKHESCYDVSVFQ